MDRNCSAHNRRHKRSSHAKADPLRGDSAHAGYGFAGAACPLTLAFSAAHLVIRAL